MPEQRSLLRDVSPFDYKRQRWVPIDFNTPRPPEQGPSVRLADYYAGLLEVVHLSREINKRTGLLKAFDSPKHRVDIENQYPPGDARRVVAGSRDKAKELEAHREEVFFRATGHTALIDYLRVHDLYAEETIPLTEINGRQALQDFIKLHAPLPDKDNPSVQQDAKQRVEGLRALSDAHRA